MLENSESKLLYLCVKKRIITILVSLYLLSISLYFFKADIVSSQLTCLTCHEQLVKEKNVHAAVHMGCESCHSAIDASDIPHKVKNKIPKGLSAAQPDICYNCHDRSEFTKNNVHMPVAGGMCTSCHNPHSTNYAFILNKGYNGLCLDCHGDVSKKPHVIKRGHPVGSDGRLNDPVIKDRKFDCGSCHVPHSSDSVKLLRYNVKSPIKICIYCHKFNP